MSNLGPPRIAPVEAPYEPEAEQLLREMMLPAAMRDVPAYQAFAEHPPLAFLRTWVKHPDLTRAFQSVRNFVHAGSLVAARERELLALRICALTGFHAEWGIRVDAYGTKAGLSEEEIEATAIPGVSPVWNEHDRALVQFVDELHETSQVSDEVWAAMTERWSEPELIELLFLVGWYHTVCFVGTGIRVEGEPWAPAYPANGIGT
jgi:4-carboxymuconolactone decarboxylase